MAKKKAAAEDDLIDETPGVGHNSKVELERIIDFVEALLEQRSNLSEDIREAMETAKLKGFDKRTIKEMIKLRALDKTVREEREDLRDQYLVALGLAD